MLIDSYRYAASSAWSADVTVASSTVASDLTDFPLYIDLADMPASFWSNTNGRDLRAYDGATQIPIDVLWCDPVTETGRAFVKVPTLASGSDTTITLSGNGTDDDLAYTHTYGRNAVWSDYAAVGIFGITGSEDRTGNTHFGLIGDPDLFSLHATSSTDTNSHQGVCWDGTHYYTTDTNAIYKWDVSWTLVATNADPVGDTGVSGLNHCGDLDVHDGKLYVPVEVYPDVGSGYNAHIAIYNASDLSFVEVHDISAQSHESSSIAYCDRDGLLYITDFVSGPALLYKYALDGTYEGTLGLSHAIPNPQGVTWWRDRFWVSQDQNDETIRVTYEGVCSRGNLTTNIGGVGFGNGITGAYEGIGHTDDGLLQALDPGTTERVEEWRPLDMALGAGGGGTLYGRTDERMQATGLSNYSTYTLGVTMNLSAKGSPNQCAVSYIDTGSSASTNQRQIIGFRGGSSNVIGLWDKNNSWLNTSTNPAIGTSYRCNAVYSGTTSRRLYVNGASAAFQSGISASPTGKDALWVGTEDGDQLELVTGSLGFVYLRASALSGDWIAAEYDNLNSPSTFYSIS